MSLRLQASRFAPWTGLFVGAAAWFADQQVSSDSNFWACSLAGGQFALLIGLLTMAVAAAGGAASWLAKPRADAPEDDSRRFARVVGAASAAIFFLAIAFGTWAGILLPACQR